MAKASTSEYNRPVKFFAGAPIPLKFPDFGLLFLKRLDISGTPRGGGPKSTVYVFELTNSLGKKTEISVVASAGIREDGPKFISNKKKFQLVVTSFNNINLMEDELVVVSAP